MMILGVFGSWVIKVFLHFWHSLVKTAMCVLKYGTLDRSLGVENGKATDIASQSESCITAWH